MLSISLIFLVVPVLGLFEADIKLDTGVLSTSVTTRWTGGNVPFTFSNKSNFTSQQVEFILDVLSEMSYSTYGTINFQYNTNSSAVALAVANFVVFDNSDGVGCWSYVGMIGGSQTVHLGGECFTRGILQHELLHVLGFWHEQSRPDRDLYVRIITENIRPNALSQFGKRDDNELLSTPYDLSSVMHYGNTAFSKNGKPTIESIETPGMKLGSGSMSKGDLIRLLSVYGGGNPTSAPTTTHCRRIKRSRRCKKKKECRWLKRKCV